MFKQGEKVAYPHHGAGVIEAVQEKTVFSEKKRYYILKLSIGQLTLNVPVHNCHELGLRSIIDKRQAAKVLKVLADKRAKITPDDCNERFRVNNDKLATGNAFSIAEVVRDLNKRLNLSAREKRLFSKAKNILTSELMFSLGKTEKETLAHIDKTLN